MIAKRAAQSRVYRLAEFVCFFLLIVANQIRGSPRLSSSPLISGIAPADGHATRPLSENQLNRLEAWLRLHQKGWRRNIIPPVKLSYMVQVEHSDGTQMFVHFFLREQFNVYFSKHTQEKRFDAGWLSLPVEEVDDLVGMLRRDA
jgi:hypothetical protein